MKNFKAVDSEKLRELHFDIPKFSTAISTQFRQQTLLVMRASDRFDLSKTLGKSKVHNLT